MTPRRAHKVFALLFFFSVLFFFHIPLRLLPIMVCPLFPISPILFSVCLSDHLIVLPFFSPLFFQTVCSATQGSRTTTFFVSGFFNFLFFVAWLR